MKIIVPLIRYYNSFLVSDEGELIKKSFNENESTLFEAVVIGEVNNDIQASKLLYDGNPSSQTYMKFKQALYSKLMKMVANFEIDKNHGVVQEKLHLLREWHSLRMLTNLSSRKLNRVLQKKILLKAERLYVYDIVANISQMLANDFKVHDKKIKEGDFYWTKYLKFKKLEDNRILAKNTYADVIKYTRKKHINQELALKAEKAADYLSSFLQIENASAYKFYFQLRYLQYILLGDHHNVINSNLEGLAYFDKFNKNIGAKSTLKIQIAISYFSLDQYDEAIKFIDTDVSPTSARWITNISLRIRAMFMKGRYSEASVFIDQIINNPSLKEGRALFKERIWLFKYYADLLRGLKTGESINTRQIKNNLTRIRVDKKAMNMPLFFAEVIQETLKNGVKHLYKERDKIEIYNNAHIKPAKNKRASLFAKFLMILPDAHYDKSTFKVKLSRIKDALIKNPLKDVMQPDNEIVNYEILISYMLDRFAPNVENIFSNVNERKLEIKETII